jgi:cytochrome b
MSAQAHDSVQVWDPLLRVLHWGLAASVLVAYASGEESILVHYWSGLAALGIVATRVAWGLLGPRHARFVNFLPTPAEVAGYLRDLLRGKARRYEGHNPLGSAMIVALLLTVLATVASGLASWSGLLGHELGEELHEVLANGILVLVALHLGGVILSSVLERQNLVRAMITGRKKGPA